MARSRDIAFLFEISALRHVDRTWKHFLHAHAANNAEHTFRMLWIALTLIKFHKGSVDHEKVLKLALMHDIAESRTGDVNYISRRYTKRDDDRALSDMSEGTIHEKELQALFHEYEERKTIESKIVKDADNLDVEIELREMEVTGLVLPKEWRRIRNTRVHKQLYTAAAKRMWKEIEKANPHDWHVHAHTKNKS